MKKLFIAIILVTSMTQCEIIEFDELLELHRSVSIVSSKRAFDKLTRDKVFVEFYQERCPPCRTLGNTLERLSQKYPSVKIVKIDVMKHREFLERYSVRSTPKSMIFVNNKQVFTATGALSYSRLEEVFKKHLL